jgi:hypothetical protein
MLGRAYRAFIIQIQTIPDACRGSMLCRLFLRHWFLFTASLTITCLSLGLVLSIVISSPKCILLTQIASCFLERNNKTYGAGLIALFTVIIGFNSWFIAYSRDIDRQRFQLFDDLHNEFRTSDQFDQVFKALSSGNRNAFRSVEIDHAEGFAAFLEKVAISVQSGLLPLNVANYFFGFYVIETMSNVYFRQKIGLTTRKSAIYWELLITFKSQIEIGQKKMRLDPKLYASRLNIL